jgi:PilZ domain
VSREDRRRHPRVVVDVPVRLEAESTTVSGRLHDICRDAALVECGQVWPVGTPVTVAFELPGTGGPLQVPGSVVRLAGDANDPRGMAILFTNLTPAAETRIDFFFALQTD